MIVGIKKNVLVVVRVVPENRAIGDRISDERIVYLKELLRCGIKIHYIISDSRFPNVTALKILLIKFLDDVKQIIVFECTIYQTYIFFNSVHIVRNIRNSLQSAKKFVFPEFENEIGGKKNCS